MRVKIEKDTMDPVIHVKVSGTVDNQSARKALQIALLELDRSNHAHLRLDLSETECTNSFTSLKLHTLVQTYRDSVLGKDTRISVLHWGQGNRLAGIDKAEHFQDAPIHRLSGPSGMSRLLLSGELCTTAN